MSKRCEVSEALLAILSAFTFLILLTFPGLLLMWCLPLWISGPLSIGIACCGPWLMWKVDEGCYGKRSFWEG